MSQGPGFSSGVGNDGYLCLSCARQHCGAPVEEKCIYLLPIAHAMHSHFFDEASQK